MKRIIVLLGIMLLLTLAAGCNNNASASLKEKDMAKVGEMV